MSIIQPIDPPAPVPGANPTIVFLSRQIGYILGTLALVSATVLLAYAGYIHDGEIVTLLVCGIGAHVIGTSTQTPQGPTVTTPTVVTTSTLPAPTIPIPVEGAPK